MPAKGQGLTLRGSPADGFVFLESIQAPSLPQPRLTQPRVRARQMKSWKEVDSTSGVKSLGTSEHPGREVDREKAALSVCLIFMPLPNHSVTLPGSYYPHLQIKKLRLREIKGLGYGHTQPERDGSGKRDQACTC